MLFFLRIGPLGLVCRPSRKGPRGRAAAGVPFRGYRLSVPPAGSRAGEGDNQHRRTHAEKQMNNSPKSGEREALASGFRHLAAQRTRLGRFQSIHPTALRRSRVWEVTQIRNEFPVAQAAWRRLGGNVKRASLDA